MITRPAQLCPSPLAPIPQKGSEGEAPDPDIIMRRPATSERTMTPAMASKRPLRVSGESRPIQYGAGNHMRQPRSSVSTTPTSSDGASATALLACGGAAFGAAVLGYELTTIL